MVIHPVLPVVNIRLVGLCIFIARSCPGPPSRDIRKLRLTCGVSCPLFW